MKIVAFVPMRHNSVRVSGKNYRMLAGKPLYHHIMEALLAVPEITDVVVDIRPTSGDILYNWRKISPV